MQPLIQYGHIIILLVRGGVKQTTDILSTSKTDNDPMFVNLDANVNAATNTNDLHLKDGSPARGKGNSVYNTDIGAYTADGKGNKH